MTESTVQIDGMMSISDDAGVEKQIMRRDGVSRVNANFLNGTATIEYDEKRVALEDIKKFIADCGYHCGGEVVPAHICELGKPSGAKPEKIEPKAATALAEFGGEKAKPAVQPPATPAKADNQADQKAEGMSTDKADMAREMDTGRGAILKGWFAGCEIAFWLRWPFQF